MDNIKSLSTETNNVRSWNIDKDSIVEILKIINEEDHLIADAVALCIPSVEKLVENVIKGFKQNGRLIYVGAGTSGRLGILDASECPPTFGVSYELVQGIIAGGVSAMIKAKEGTEDNADLGVQDIIDLHIRKNDIIVGIAASGRTPYVIGALRQAKKMGACTAAISCVENALISKEVDIAIEAITGSEVICGSTRMKAGTATKMILNMISSTAMVKMGKTYHNYMVDVMATNEKLVARALQMIKVCVDCDDVSARHYFEESNHHVKTAILMGLSGQKCDVCKHTLNKFDGSIPSSLQYLREST